MKITIAAVVAIVRVAEQFSMANDEIELMTEAAIRICARPEHQTAAGDHVEALAPVLRKWFDDNLVKEREEFRARYGDKHCWWL